MKEQKKIISATLTGLIALGALTPSIANATPDQPYQWEKCSGIAKAGLNDCAALDGSHACSGKAKRTNSDVEWVYTPHGTCTKITGGVVKGIKRAKRA